MFKKIYISIFTLTIMITIQACQQAPVKPIEDDRQISTLGLVFANKPRLIPGQEKCGLKILSVASGSTAERTGLRSQDVIVGYDDVRFKNCPTNLADSFRVLIKERKPGDWLTLHIYREDQKFKGVVKSSSEKPQEEILDPFTFLKKIKDRGQAQDLEARWSWHPEEFELRFQLEGRNWAYGNQPVKLDHVPSAVLSSETFTSGIRKIIDTQAQQSSKDEQALRERLQDLSQKTDAIRLPVVSATFQNPYRVKSLQEQLQINLKKCAGNSFDKMWSCWPPLLNFSGLDLETEVAALKGIGQEKTPADFLKSLALVYSASQDQLDQAYRFLSSEEKRFLKTNAGEMLEGFNSQDDFVDAIDDQKRELYLRYFKLLEKIDRKFVLKSLLIYRSVLDNFFVKRLKQSVAVADAKKSRVVEYRNSDGLFILAGEGNNDHQEYAGRDDVKWIIDLGGYDFYPNITANILDLGGHDIYETNQNFQMASAILDTKILMDLGGDDIYQSTQGSLGFALGGAALLYDQQGHDKYVSTANSQAVGWMGIALLIDDSGDDEYRSKSLSQGVGVGGGFGFLLDFSGNDIYESKGLYPSEYADPGQSSGLSQAVGLGVRQLASGGWGLIYDRSGRDLMKAGTFSQGGGYYFGMGTLISDGTESDEYWGDRYNQGWSAHQAIAVFSEEGGDDEYHSFSHVGLGLAWDQGITLFLEKQGNDKYLQPGHFIGSAFHNSFAFFIDEQGADQYEGEGLPYKVKENTYHGGKSFGIFWDKGNQKDSYKNLKNNTTLVLPGWQVLVDE